MADSSTPSTGSSLFQGTAQPTPNQTYVSQTTEYPKWLQDAIYNQINTATQIANTPYQEYGFPTVAEIDKQPDIVNAYADLRANQYSWQPAMDYASQGMALLATQPGQVAASTPYYQTAAGMSGLEAAQPSFTQQANMLGGIDYSAASNDLYAQQNQYMSPDLANYYLQGGSNTLGAVSNMDIGAQASPFFQQQANVLSALNYNNPANNLSTGQNQYLNPALANQYLQSGNTAYGVVGQMDIAAAANPYLSSQMSALSGLNYNAPLAAYAASQNKYISPDVANTILQRGQTALTTAAGVDVGAAANPYIQQQLDALKGINLNAAATDLNAAQNKYISPDLANQALQSAQQAYTKSGGVDVSAAVNPYLQNQINYLNAIDYNKPSSTLSAQQNQYLNPTVANALLQNAQTGYNAAGKIDIAGAANPYLQNQAQTLNALDYNTAVQNLFAQQNKYTSSDLANALLQSAQKGYNVAGGMDVAGSASPYLQNQAQTLNALNYNAPLTEFAAQQNKYLSPDLANALLQSAQKGYNTAGGMDVAAAASPYLQNQAQTLNALNYNAPLTELSTQQNKYLSPDLANALLQSAQKGYNVAGGMDVAAAASPYLQNQAQTLNALNYNAATQDLLAQQNKYISPDLANNMLQQGQKAYNAAGTMDVAGAANPYLKLAAQSSAAGLGQYMNPYQEGVMNAIAQQGARNLSENLLPAISDAFVKAGQFGGSRMGEFGSRALRDTQEAILNQQSQALQQGYGQALSASQADLARQAQLASTAGQLTGQQQAALTSIGQAQTAAGQAQQQAGLSAAQNVAQSQQQALSQAQQTAAQQNQMAALAGQLTGQQQSALTNIAQAQAASGLGQQQAGLGAAQVRTAAQQQALSQAQQTAAQQNQMAALAGQLTGQQQSALANIAQGQAASGLAQQQAGLGAAQARTAAQQQALTQAQQTAAQQGQMAALTGQLTGQQQSTLASIAQGQAAAGAAQQQAGLSAAQNLTAAQQQALTQAQQTAAQQGQMAGLAGQLTAQQQSALTALAQAQASGAQAQQQFGLNAAQNVGSAQQQSIAQMLQGAAQQNQMASLVGQLTTQQQAALLGLGQAQAQFGQAQQQAGLGAAQNISAAQQQAINQAIQRASQYGQTAQLAGQLTGQQQTNLANIGQIQAQAALGQQQAGLGAAQNLTAAQQQALTQAQQGAAQYGQAAQLAGQLTGQQAQSLLNLGQAQTAAGQAQQQYGLSALQNLANVQQQALGQAQQTASQYGQMGQNAAQVYGQQMANMLNLAQTQLGAGQAQQQTGIGAAQYLANLRQQGVGQALQGASQYGALGSALGSLTQDQQKILAGIGQNIGSATGADLNTQMAALNNIAALATQEQGMQAKDVAALEAIGMAQQQNQQQQLTASYNQWLQQQMYPQQMADWMNTQIRGMAPITPSQTSSSTQGNTYTYGPSPLSQILGAYAAYRGFTGG